MLQLSHINLHFDFKNSLQCIYLIINVIFTLLENIFMNFKVFILIFDISIFIKKYPPIYLRYIHKMQVPIYPSKPIFSTLLLRVTIKGNLLTFPLSYSLNMIICCTISELYIKADVQSYSDTKCKNHTLT